MDDPTNPEPDEQHGVPVHDAWRMSEPVAGPPSAEHLVALPAFEATGAPEAAGAQEATAEPGPARG